MESTAINALLLGGPMYEALYDHALPRFERDTGMRVNVLARLPHPELNAEVARRFASADHGIDLLSTHTKYAPSQAEHLLPLDAGTFAADRLVPSVRALSTMRGQLMQVPRFLDLQLLYVRASAFTDAAAQEQHARSFGQTLAPPTTWAELVNVASSLTHSDRYGFVFPGRDSGLFGTFYEMLVAGGGDLFSPQLEPIFSSPAGWWAADALAELHTRRRSTPRALADWHYDEISLCFRRGHAAMVADWPGSDGLYRDANTCVNPDDVQLHPLPLGFADRRAAYGGCHSFAIARTARNPEGAAQLLHYLTSQESRVYEAGHGAVPVTFASMAHVQAAAASSPRQQRRWQLLSDQIESALIIPPRFAAYPRCETILWQALQRVMLGQVSARAGLDAAAAEMRTVVKGQTAL